jgi:hypothetical protein
MSAVPSAPPVAPKRQRKPRTTGGVELGKDTSRDARRLAAAILEVLAGMRTPSQAATALALSVPRYYQLEAQALRGLLRACEPRPKGRQRGSSSELAELRRRNEQLQREVTRQQSLVRVAQRTVGLTPPALAPAKTAGKKRKRKPVARALHVAARLRQEDGTATADNGLSGQG